MPILFNEQSFNEPYWGAWRSGIQQGIETPIIGVGPSMTRKNCHNLISKEFLGFLKKLLWQSST